MTAASALRPLELDPLIAEARRRTRHRRLLGALLFVALGVAAAMLAFGSPAGWLGFGVGAGRSGAASAVGKPRPGPLAWEGGSGSVGAPVNLRQVDTEAIPLGSTESHKAVLLDVHLQHGRTSPGLTIRYAATTGGHGLHLRAFTGGTGTDAAIGWPRARWRLRPIRGFVVPPHTTPAIVIGTSATKPGVYRVMRNFVVDYRIGGVFYHAVVPWGVDICAAVSCSANS